MKFKEEAEKHLIHIEKDSKYGWTTTSPTEELIDYIISKGWNEITMNREYGFSFGRKGGSNGTTAGTTTPTAKTSSTRKYICPKCGNSVRATKVINIICGDCTETMIEA